jgi:peptidoglycan hydrolase-like protein with peptidoglycan-binding domain
MTTNEVKEIQNALMSKNFPLPRYGADGILGTETSNAIASFQNANGIRATGVLDQETYDKLLPDVKKVIVPPSKPVKGGILERLNQNKPLLYGGVAILLGGLYYWNNKGRKKRK